MLSWDKWETDSWELAPDYLPQNLVPERPFITHVVGDAIVYDAAPYWVSVGGFARGCSNTVVLQRVADHQVTYTITTTLRYENFDSDWTCSSSIGGPCGSPVPVFDPRAGQNPLFVERGLWLYYPH